MSPAERAAYEAERPIYDACARTEKALITLNALRRLTAQRLPIAAAERALDGIDDELAAIATRLATALTIQTANIDRMHTLTEVSP